MEGSGSQKSRSSVDVRLSGDTTPLHSGASRRRKFFSSFRRKFRGEKYKDKNSNIEQLSASQPNIYKSSCHTPNVSRDDNCSVRSNKTSNVSQVYSRDRQVTPVSDLEMSPKRIRSRTESDVVTMETMSSEDREEVDSGIAVIETTNISQVCNTQCNNDICKNFSVM